MVRDNSSNTPKRICFEDTTDIEPTIPDFILALDKINLYAVMLSQAAKINNGTSTH